MDFFTFLKSLDLSKWYNLIIALSFVATILFLFLPVLVLSNATLACFSTGILSISIAIKIYAEKRAGYSHELIPALLIQYVLIGAGIMLILFGVYKII